MRTENQKKFGRQDLVVLLLIIGTFGCSIWLLLDKTVLEIELENCRRDQAELERCRRFCADGEETAYITEREACLSNRIALCTHTARGVDDMAQGRAYHLCMRSEVHWCPGDEE